VVRVYPIGAVTRGLRGEELAELAELAESGFVPSPTTAAA